jgi:hypothetical protein
MAADKRRLRPLDSRPHARRYVILGEVASVLVDHLCVVRASHLRTDSQWAPAQLDLRDPVTAAEWAVLSARIWLKRSPIEIE